jgi:hypothetical protein
MLTDRFIYSVYRFLPLRRLDEMERKQAGCRRLAPDEHRFCIHPDLLAHRHYGGLGLGPICPFRGNAVLEPLSAKFRQERFLLWSEFLYASRHGDGRLSNGQT